MTLKELEAIEFNPEMYEIAENRDKSKDYYLHFKDSYVGEIKLPKNLTNCNNLFKNCNIQEGCYIGDNFNTIDVTNMESMFEGAILPKGFTLGPNFYTSEKTNMYGMFGGTELYNGFSFGNKFNMPEYPENCFRSTQYGNNVSLFASKMYFVDVYSLHLISKMTDVKLTDIIEKILKVHYKTINEDIQNLRHHCTNDEERQNKLKELLDKIDNNVYEINNYTIFENNDKIFVWDENFEFHEYDNIFTYDLEYVKNFIKENESITDESIKKSKNETLLLEYKLKEEANKLKEEINKIKEMLDNSVEPESIKEIIYSKNKQTNKITVSEGNKINEIKECLEKLEDSKSYIKKSNLLKESNEYFKEFYDEFDENKIMLSLQKDINADKMMRVLNSYILNNEQTLKELIDLKYDPNMFEIKKCEVITPYEKMPTKVSKATYYHLHFKDTYEGEIKIPAGLSNLDNLFEDCNIKPGCYLSEECEFSKVTSMQDMFKNATGLDDKLFSVDGYTVFKDTNQLIIYNDEGTKCSFDDIILSNPDLLKAINDKLNELENNKEIENHEKEDISNDTI